VQLNIPEDIFTYPQIPLPAVWSVEQKFTTLALSAEAIEIQVTLAVKEFLAPDCG
jgi:hypothetical protein